MTSTDNTKGGAADRRRSLPGRAWAFVVDALAALGTALIAGLMLIICADIVARNGMGSSLPLVSELGALLLVMIVCLQLAATIRADRLARAGLFITPMREARPRVGAAFEAAFCLVGALMVGMMAWATTGVLETDWERGEFIGTPGLGTLPTWPFRLFILIGLTVAALEFLSRAARAVRVAAGHRESLE